MYICLCDSGMHPPSAHNALICKAGRGHHGDTADQPQLLPEEDLGLAAVAVDPWSCSEASCGRY